jgi:hypothetical protein
VNAFGGRKPGSEFFELLRVVLLRDAQAIGANRNDLWLDRHGVTYRSNKVTPFVINDEACRLKARGTCLT